MALCVNCDGGHLENVFFYNPNYEASDIYAFNCAPSSIIRTTVISKCTAKTETMETIWRFFDFDIITMSGKFWS